MARSANSLTAVFTDTANAIRNKTGETGPILPRDFADKINEIETSSVEAEGTITINRNGTYDVSTYEYANVSVFEGAPKGNFLDLSTESFSKDLTVLSSFMFADCSDIYGVYIPSPIVTINKNCFSACANLETIEIAPNANRIFDQNWIAPDCGANIYFNGTVNQWFAQRFSYLDVVNIYDRIYVLDENGEVLYNGRTYSPISNYDTAVFDSKASLVLDILNGAFNIQNIVIPNTVKCIYKYLETNNFLTYFENVYFNGTLAEWLDIRFESQPFSAGYSQKPENNPMYYAKHLYILDENGLVELNGNTYSEVTSLTVAPRDGGNVLDQYAVVGYNGGVKQLIVSNGVITLDSYAIYHNHSITSITLPNSLMKLNNSAIRFNGIRTLILPENTSELGSLALSYNYNLYRLVINYTGNITFATDACRYNYNLLEIENHASNGLATGSTNFGYVAQNAKYISSSSASNIQEDQNGFGYFQDNTDHYFAYFPENTIQINVPAHINKTSSSAASLILNNNIEEFMGSALFKFEANSLGFGLKKIEGALATSLGLNHIKLLGTYIMHQLTTYPLTYTLAISSGKYNHIADLNVTVAADCKLISGYFNNVFNIKTFTVEQSETALSYSSYFCNQCKLPVTVDLSTRPISTGGSYFLNNVAGIKNLKILLGNTTASSTYLSGLKNLEKIEINTSTSRDIGSIFTSCFNVKEVTIGANITGLYPAFPSYKLSKITFMSSTPPILKSSFTSNTDLSNIKIYVPRGSLNDYLNATNFPDSSEVEYIEY